MSLHHAMTRQRLREIVRGFRYKPGWRFRVDGSGDIEILANVKDVYHPSLDPLDPPRTYVVVTKYKLERWRTRDVIERVADAVQRLENHEFGEWFRYRGRRTYDPHG